MNFEASALKCHELGWMFTRFVHAYWYGCTAPDHITRLPTAGVEYQKAASLRSRIVAFAAYPDTAIL